jgi:hypothetical protein
MSALVDTLELVGSLLLGDALPSFRFLAYLDALSDRGVLLGSDTLVPYGCLFGTWTR